MHELLVASAVMDAAMAEQAALQLARAREAGEHKPFTAALERSLLLEQDPEATWGAEHNLYDFHRLVAAMSTNKVLMLVSEALSQLHRGRLEAVPTPPAATDTAFGFHRGIADAIIAGEAPEAGRIMFRHMNDYIDGLASAAPWILEEVVAWS